MLRIIIFSFLLVSCAGKPHQSVEISRALKTEGNRMHQMNIALVECVFNEKKHMVNEYIANEYAPAVAENFIKRLPPDTDVKREMPYIIAAINPKIDARRDSLLAVLQFQKMLVLEQLNADWLACENVFTGFQNLLASANKPGKRSASVYDAAKKLNANKLNLRDINNALDSFITGESCVKEKAAALANTVQSFLR